MSAEYGVSVSALRPIVHAMEVTEEDSPAIHQCKCAISKELRSRWSLNSIDPTSPGSDLVAVCLDPQFKQAIFLKSHQHQDLQMATLNWLIDKWQTQSSSSSSRS